MASKSQKQIKQTSDDLQLQKNMTNVLKEQLDFRTKAGKIGKDILANTKFDYDISSKLNKIAEARKKIVEGRYEIDGKIQKLSEEQEQILLRQLDTADDLLETEKQRKDAADAIKDAGKDIAKDLAGAFGVSSQLVDALIAGGVAAAAFVILKEIASYIGEGIKRMKEFNKETGASVSSMLEMEGGLIAARAEAGMMKYSMDEIRASAEAVRNSTGQIVVDPSLLADITEVNSVLKDADKAQSLTRTLKNSGKDASELTKSVKDMADSMNMDAGPAMEYLADNQLALRGLTEEQIIARAEEALTVKKMGVDLKKAKQLASESLDIEKSMKDEMKLRMITGKDINMNALRAAQASGDANAVAREQKKLIDSVGGSLNGNLQLQRMIGDATGLATEDMLNIQNATSEQAQEMAKGADATKESSEAMKSMGGFGAILLKVIGGIGVGLIAIAAASKIFKLMNKGGGKNPIAKFMGDFGATEVLKGALAMLLISASMFVMAKAISAMPTEVGPYVGMAVGLGLMLGALYLLAKFPTADLLKGALALAVVGVSLIPFAYAMNLIGDISIGAILAVAAGILIFTGIIMGLGLVMFSGIGAMIFGAGILALLALGAAMIVLGAGIVIFNKGVSGLGDNISIFVEKMGELIAIAPMMLGAVIPLIAFGIALMPFALGLTMATLPMLTFGLAMIPFVAGMTLLSGIMPIFVESVAKLGEQVPNLIAIAGGFGVLAASFMLATAAMIPFFPTFTATTLGMLALVPAMLLTAGATGIWSLSLSSLSDSIQRLMPNLTAFLGVMPMMAAMIMLVPGLIALSASFLILSASLVALSGGLAIVTLLLPTLFALAFALPLISNALGGGGDSGGDGGGESSSMSEVVDEIKGLRQDIQNQPIMINVDGRVVSEITKVQSRKLSTRSAGYFGG